MTTLFRDYSTQVSSRLRAIDEEARSGGLDGAIELIVNAIENDGVLHAFGTGHSEAFAMEVAGRAGGFIPTHAIALRDLVLFGGKRRLHPRRFRRVGA